MHAYQSWLLVVFVYFFPVDAVNRHISAQGVPLINVSV